MPATFDAVGTDVTSNGVTTKDLTTLTVGSGSNRALVVQLVWSGSVTAVSVTWDQGGTNQACAAITGATATNTGMVQLWGLVAPTSGNKTLRVSWTTSRDVVVQAVSWTDVDQTGGTTTFAHGTGATGTGTTSTATVTSAANNAVMAVFSNNTDLIDAVNNTQTFIENTPANVGGAGNRAAGAASVAMTATNHVSSTWAAAGCDIVAFTGAADTLWAASSL